MKLLLFLPLLLLVVPQQPASSENSQVDVVSYKWEKARRVMELGQGSSMTPPASAMIAANKNFARNVRANDPPGVRDPNADTLDGRSAQIEKNVQEARAPESKPVDGFTYKAKVQNNSPNVIEVLFWEYEVFDQVGSSGMTRHQFICGVSIRPNTKTELVGFSLANPSNVISVDSLAKKGNTFQEKVVINRVEYADGTIWQRQDWSLKDVKNTYDRALKETWVPGMCKNL